MYISFLALVQERVVPMWTKRNQGQRIILRNQVIRFEKKRTFWNYKIKKVVLLSQRAGEDTWWLSLSLHTTSFKVLFEGFKCICWENLYLQFMDCFFQLWMNSRLCHAAQTCFHSCQHGINRAYRSWHAATWLVRTPERAESRSQHLQSSARLQETLVLTKCLCVLHLATNFRIQVQIRWTLLFLPGEIQKID